MSKTVVIDPGHGGKDKGAVNGNLYESDLNLKAALAARDYLSNYDVNVIMTRIEDTGITIGKRTALAKNNNADASVSIHHNAGGGDGAEVYYWHTDNEAKKLAEMVLRRLLETGQNSRGVKESRPGSYNFGMCRINAANGIPAVLGEYAFLDNENDRKMIDSDAKLKAEGEAYGKAIVDFLGLEKRRPAAKPVSGSTVFFAGGYHFPNAAAEAPTGEKRSAGNARLTAAAPGKPHPYHLIGVPGGSNVYGWVDAAKINPEEDKPIAAGDVLRLASTPLYFSAYTKNPSTRINGTYWIYDGQPVRERYRVTNRADRVNKKPATLNVTGWIDKGDAYSGRI